MSWGEKPIVKSWLDSYIYHTDTNDDSIKHEVEESNRKIKKFAYVARDLTGDDFKTAIEYVAGCKLEKETTEDVYYVIDHTGLSSLQKLLLKIYWVFA